MLKPTMQIKEFYISPKYRKLNLANDLFHHIEVAADMLGVFKIEVLCNLTATTTQNFYLRNKFKIDKKSYVKLI
jgi:GNAT superfamily N-acetyltransferase